MLSMVMSSGALPPAEVAAGCVVMLCTAGLGLHFAATGGSSVFVRVTWGVSFIGVLLVY